MAPLILRPEWGGIGFVPQHMGIVDTVFFHHSVTSAAQEIRAACRDLERHALGLGHRAIDYSFVAHQDGQRAEGRGWFVQGGHTINNNSTSYGICGLGNFAAGDRATEGLIQAYVDTINEGVYLGALRPNPRLRPHSDVFATACPGTLRDIIPEVARRVANGAAPPSSEEDDDMKGPIVYNVTLDGGKWWWCRGWARSHIADPKVADQLRFLGLATTGAVAAEAGFIQQFLDIGTLKAGDINVAGGITVPPLALPADYFDKLADAVKRGVNAAETS